MGASCCLSLLSCVITAATMICAALSTAICALYACTKLPLCAPSGMMRLSGSVKLRCAVGSGRACSGSGIRGARPASFWPRSSSFFRRSASFCAASFRAASARSRASCSSAALAAAIFLSRLARRASSPVSSSPRFPFPYCRSSAASVSAACASDLGRALRWNSELAKEWLAQQNAAELYFYCDGHVRVYHGRQTALPRHYVSRERLCLRATTDYWINAMDGQPFLYVNEEVDPGLIATLKQDVIPWLEAQVVKTPEQERLLVEK